MLQLLCALSQACRAINSEVVCCRCLLLPARLLAYSLTCWLTCSPLTHARYRFTLLLLPQAVQSREDHIFEDLATPLRADLMRHMNKELLGKIHLLQLYDDDGFVDMISRAMEPLFFVAGEEVVQEGEQVPYRLSLIHI